MKRILYLPFCLLLLMCVSCDEKHISTDGSIGVSYPSDADTRKTEVKQDVSLGDLYVKYNALEGKVCNLRDSLQNIQEKANDFDEKASCLARRLDMWFAILGFFIIVVMLLSWRHTNKKTKYLKNEISKFDSSLKDLKQKQQYVNAAGNKSTNADVSKPSFEIQRISKELEELKKHVADIQINGDVEKDTKAQKLISTQERKYGYWGENDEDDIRKEYCSMQDECCFKVEYISDKEAKFEPINVNKLSRIDKCAVEKTGCSAYEAQCMEVLEQGRASLKHSNDGSRYWHIEKRAKVRLTK